MPLKTDPLQQSFNGIYVVMPGTFPAPALPHNLKRLAQFEGADEDGAPFFPGSFFLPILKKRLNAALCL